MNLYHPQTKSIQIFKSLLLSSILYAGSFSGAPLMAQETESSTTNSSVCKGLFFANTQESALSNQVSASFDTSNTQNFITFSRSLVTATLQVIHDGKPLDLNSEENILNHLQNLGVSDANGKSIASLGPLVDALTKALVEIGLDPETANVQSLFGIKSFVETSPEILLDTTITRIINKLQQNLNPSQQKLIAQNLDQIALTKILMGVHPEILAIYRLSETDTENIDAAITKKLNSLLNGKPIDFSAAQAEIQDLLPKEAISKIQSIHQTITNLRNQKNLNLQQGDNIYFNFLLENDSAKDYQLRLPTIADLQQYGLVGSGEILKIDYQIMPIKLVKDSEVDNISKKGNIDTTTTESTEILLRANAYIKIAVKTKIGELDEDGSLNVSLNLSANCGSLEQQQSLTYITVPADSGLIDPFGQVTNCDGGLIEDYTGFQIALYNTNTNDPTYPLRGLTELTLTEIPDNPNNKVPLGLEPNDENANPFFLTNADQGKYSFLFDESRGQLKVGRTYILVVTPPPNSIYRQRRIRIELLARQGNQISYEAKAIDGQPIGIISDGEQIDPFVAQGSIFINDANTEGLKIFTFSVANVSICEVQEIQITKTANQIAAEPGDTVLYRLNVKSLASSSIEDISMQDTLPVGLKLVEDVIKAEFKGKPINVTTTINGRNIQFDVPISLETQDSFNLVYAAQVTPDGMRGDGENLAYVEGIRSNSGKTVGDGPAIHRLKIEPGIISDYGTIVGRVFIDKNFDGQQQRGEPGLPNAVIYLEDGNRIMTDANGLYTVENVLPGYHTGILDLESVPGYTLAPNRRFISDNSQTRMVHLEPSGMVRMNFAVTPAFNQEQQ